MVAYGYTDNTTGGGGGAVTSVDGHTGDVILTGTYLQQADNLSDLANAGTARTNLGLGNSATKAVGTTTGTVAAGDDSRITGAAQKASNLSDLGSAGTARTNLGLGGAAVLNVGTSASTVAAGDDSRITGAAQKSSNLSDLGSASTARTNLGLGGAATLNVGTSSGTVAAGDDSRITGALPKSGGTMTGLLTLSGDPSTSLQAATKQYVDSVAGGGGGGAVTSVDGHTGAVVLSGTYLAQASNLSDLANAATARTNLGLGGAAVLNVGTGAGTVAAGNDSRLSDTRTPSTGSVVDASVSASAAIALSKLATNPLARANHTGTQTASTISDFDTQVRTSRLDQMTAPTADVSMNSHKLTSLTNGASSGDAVNKGQLDLKADLAGAAFTGGVSTTGYLGASGQAIGIPTPASNNLVAWAYDLMANEVTSADPTRGTVYLVALYPTVSTNITKIYWAVDSAGAATLTASQNKVGLLNSSGTVLQNTDVTTAAQTAGLKTTTITSQAVTAGSMYWVAFLFNGTNATDPPGLSRGGGLTGGTSPADALNAGLSASAFRIATNGTTQTSLTNRTPASNSASGAQPFWCAIGA